MIARPLNRSEASVWCMWLAALALALAASPASAQLQGGTTQGQIAPTPVAVPVFLADDPKLGADVAGVVASDLGNSGLFAILDPASYLDQIRDVNAAPNFTNWRAIKADALVAGKVTHTPDGHLTAEFRLWDTVNGRQKAAQRFTTSAQNFRRIGHLIADVVYEQMTGEKGYFDTRVVFVDETGPKDHRTKRLAIMDQDGANVRLLSQGKELVLTPRFNPVAQEIAFMAYQGPKPKVYVMNLETGQRQQAGDFPGETFAPRYSPDGQHLLMSVSDGANTSIYEVDLKSQQSRRLTQTAGLDTSPCYSPDARQIVFESDREGTQQLYIMAPDGSGVRRLSTGEGRYSTPVWSPRGDFIAFTKQLGGQFLIGVMRPDGTGERILSEGFHGEGPTWAPNGRVLMFFREGQGANAGAQIRSVDVTGYNERTIPTPAFASDPAWSPLLN